MGGDSLPSAFLFSEGLEIPLQALHRFSETHFKFIQLNWSEYSGYVQQEWFAPLLNQFSLIDSQND